MHYLQFKLHDIRYRCSYLKSKVRQKYYSYNHNLKNDKNIQGRALISLRRSSRGMFNSRLEVGLKCELSLINKITNADHRNPKQTSLASQETNKQDEFDNTVSCTYNSELPPLIDLYDHEPIDENSPYFYNEGDPISLDAKFVRMIQDPHNALTGCKISSLASLNESTQLKGVDIDTSANIEFPVLTPKRIAEARKREIDEHSEISLDEYTKALARKRKTTVLNCCNSGFGNKAFSPSIILEGSTEMLQRKHSICTHDAFCSKKGIDLLRETSSIPSEQVTFYEDREIDMRHYDHGQLLEQDLRSREKLLQCVNLRVANNSERTNHLIKLDVDTKNEENYCSSDFNSAALNAARASFKLNMTARNKCQNPTNYSRTPSISRRNFLNGKEVNKTHMSSAASDTLFKNILVDIDTNLRTRYPMQSTNEYHIR